jgi:hypothetical protein
MNEQRREHSEHSAEIAELTALVVGQIRQLSQLREEGILTDEEFAAKKQELLARL